MILNSPLTYSSSGGSLGRPVGGKVAESGRSSEGIQKEFVRHFEKNAVSVALWKALFNEKLDQAELIGISATRSRSKRRDPTLRNGKTLAENAPLDIGIVNS